MSFDPLSCDLLLCNSSSDVYRLNLDAGRYMQSLSTMSKGINCADMNPIHRLYTFGTDDGFIECFDPRDRTRVARLSVAESMLASTDAVHQRIGRSLADYAVTSLASDMDGLSLAIGTSTGHVCLFDLRHRAVELVKTHRNDLSIIDVSYHRDCSGVQRVVSTDAKSVKIWDKLTGDAYTGIESSVQINATCLIDDACGLVLNAIEQQRCSVHYIPSLGPAPNWCAFLDTLTEELEESKSTQQNNEFVDFKFVSRDQLIDLGANHLIGSTLLRAYMHGYFMKIALYEQLKAAQKTEIEVESAADRAKIRVKQRLEKAIKDRIVIKTTLPKVNVALAKELQTKKRSRDNDTQLVDDRFAQMFDDTEFEIDATSAEYRRLNPASASAKARIKQQQVDESEDDLKSISDQDDQRHSDSQEDSKSEEEDHRLQLVESAPSKSAVDKSKRNVNMYHLAPGVSVDRITADKADCQSRLSAIESLLLTSSSTRNLTLEQRLALADELKAKQAAEQSTGKFAYSSHKRQKREQGLTDDSDWHGKGSTGSSRGSSRGAKRGRNTRGGTSSQDNSGRRSMTPLLGRDKGDSVIRGGYRGRGRSTQRGGGGGRGGGRGRGSSRGRS